MDLLKLKFVNDHDENWEIEYNSHIWEYFYYHGTTPDGRPLNLPTTVSEDYKRKGKEL